MAASIGFVTFIWPSIIGYDPEGYLELAIAPVGGTAVGGERVLYSLTEESDRPTTHVFTQSIFSDTTSMTVSEVSCEGSLSENLYNCIYVDTRTLG